MFEDLKTVFWTGEPAADVVRQDVVDDAIAVLKTGCHLCLDYLTSAEVRQVEAHWTTGEPGNSVQNYNRSERSTDVHNQ